MDGYKYMMTLRKAYELLEKFNPWLVGSGVKFYSLYQLYQQRAGEAPEDIDIIIPKQYYNQEDFYKILPANHEYTSMGGYRIFIDDVQIDIWIDDVGEYVIEVPTAVEGVALNLKSGAKICTGDYLVSFTLSQQYAKDISECNYLISHREVRKGSPECVGKFLSTKTLLEGVTDVDNSLPEMQGTLQGAE